MRRVNIAVGQGAPSRDTAPPPPPPGPAVYEKLKPLGAGSFGSVFLVQHRVTGRQLVMKEVVLRGLNAAALSRSRDEVKFLKSLHHPHLIGYRDSFLDERLATLYILMEHAAGGDLKARIEKAAAAKPSPLPFAEPLVLKWLVQCVSALAFCHHDLKLLHRDIKPANIFLTLSDDVKIGDFGLSKALAASNMQAISKVGSPVYMSPELCQGKPYDRSADVWALGCTFYHACALRQPWVDQLQGKQGFMNLMRTICSKPLDLQGLRGRYSFEFCNLLAALVSKDSAARPSMKEVLATPLVQNSDLFRMMMADRAGAGRQPPPQQQSLPQEQQQQHGGAGATAGAPEEQQAPTARGTEAHVAAAVLQRSFHRHVSRGRGTGALKAGMPKGYSAALKPSTILLS